MWLAWCPTGKHLAAVIVSQEAAAHDADGQPAGEATVKTSMAEAAAAAEAAMTAMNVAMQRRQGASSEDMDHEDGVLLHQVRCQGPLAHRSAGSPPGMHSRAQPSSLFCISPCATRNDRTSTHNCSTRSPPSCANAAAGQSWQRWSELRCAIGSSCTSDDRKSGSSRGGKLNLRAGRR